MICLVHQHRGNPGGFVGNHPFARFTNRQTGHLAVPFAVDFDVHPANDPLFVEVGAFLEDPIEEIVEFPHPRIGRGREVWPAFQENSELFKFEFGFFIDFLPLGRRRVTGGRRVENVTVGGEGRAEKAVLTATATSFLHHYLILFLLFRLGLLGLLLRLCLLFVGGLLRPDLLRLRDEEGVGIFSTLSGIGKTR